MTLSEAQLIIPSDNESLSVFPMLNIFTKSKSIGITPLLDRFNLHNFPKLNQQIDKQRFIQKWLIFGLLMTKFRKNFEAQGPVKV